MIPTSITYHQNSGFIAHYPDRQLPFSHLSQADRAAAIAEIVARYNVPLTERTEVGK